MVTMPLSVTTAVTAGAEDAVTEPVGGKYENGITWSFDGETLILEGTGSSEVNDNDWAPWSIYKKQVKMNLQRLSSETEFNVLTMLFASVRNSLRSIFLIQYYV